MKFSHFFIFHTASEGGTPDSEWRTNRYRRLFRVDCSPEFFDDGFSIEAVGTGGTFRIGPIPVRAAFLSGAQDATPWHLEVTVGISFLHPFPSVAKPIVAFRFGQ